MAESNEIFKVGVMGGAGFLGSHVADELSKRGYQVLIFDQKHSPYLKGSQESVIGDLLDKKNVQDFVYDIK